MKDADARLLGEIIRIGTISSVDETAGRARVLFKDRQNMVSDFLPVLMPYTDGGAELPQVGERVICIYLPFEARGIIIGKIG